MAIEQEKRSLPNEETIQKVIQQNEIVHQYVSKTKQMKTDYKYLPAVEESSKQKISEKEIQRFVPHIKISDVKKKEQEKNEVDDIYADDNKEENVFLLERDNKNKNRGLFSCFFCWEAEEKK